MTNARRTILLTLIVLSSLAAGCLGGADEPPSNDTPDGGDDGANGTPPGNNTDDGADGNNTGGQDDGGNTTDDEPDDGTGDDGMGGDADAPEDYNATYNGTIQPGFSQSWTFPVNSTTAQQVAVTFTITGEPLPASPAHVNLTLTDANATVVRSVNVTATEPTVEWVLTGAEAGVMGQWTLVGEGAGIGEDNLGGARYDLTIEVAY